MDLIGISQAQWDETWYRLPASIRYIADEAQENEFKLPLLRIGNLFVYPDETIAKEIVNQRVSDTMAGMRDGINQDHLTLSRFTTSHFEEFDGPLNLANTTKLYGTLWYGNCHPTLILSSKENKEDMMRKLIPNLEMKWHKGQRSFKFHGAIWTHCTEITDGKVYMLNDFYPGDAKFNGWLDTNAHVRG